MKAFSLGALLVVATLATSVSFASLCDGTWAIDLQNGAGPAYGINMQSNGPQTDSVSGSFTTYGNVQPGNVAGLCRVRPFDGQGQFDITRSFPGGSQRFVGQIVFDTWQHEFQVRGQWFHNNQPQGNFYGTMRTNYQPPPPPSADCAGTYAINANGGVGTLTIGQNGSIISGSMLFNGTPTPISGTCQNGVINFTRTFQGGYQQYSGNVQSDWHGRKSMFGQFNHLTNNHKNEAYGLQWSAQ